MKYFSIACWVLTVLAGLLAAFPIGDNSDAKAGGEFIGIVLTCIFGCLATGSTVFLIIMKLWG